MCSRVRVRAGRRLRHGPRIHARRPLRVPLFSRSHGRTNSPRLARTNGRRDGFGFPSGDVGSLRARASPLLAPRPRSLRRGARLSDTGASGPRPRGFGLFRRRSDPRVKRPEWPNMRAACFPRGCGDAGASLGFFLPGACHRRGGAGERRRTRTLLGREQPLARCFGRTDDAGRSKRLGSLLGRGASRPRSVSAGVPSEGRAGGKGGVGRGSLQASSRTATR